MKMTTMTLTHHSCRLNSATAGTMMMTMRGCQDCQWRESRFKLGQHWQWRQQYSGRSRQAIINKMWQRQWQQQQQRQRSWQQQSWQHGGTGRGGFGRQQVAAVAVALATALEMAFMVAGAAAASIKIIKGWRRW
jgi:hypothetical protein